jgi:glycosyltransferase involved in cell wall biosynthesis
VTWIVVTEEDVLPADTGGRVDHLGFLEAAYSASRTLLVLVPSRGLAERCYARRFPGLVVVALSRDERWRRHLTRRPYVVASRPIPHDIAAIIRRAPSQPTAVVSLSVRSAHIGERLATMTGLPHLVRCQNLDSEYFRTLIPGASGPRKLAYFAESLRLKRFERWLNKSGSVDAFADISSVDAERHRGQTPAPVLHIPPFTAATTGETAPSPPSAAAREGVVFSGSLDSETNQEALSFLLDRVWPAVAAARPEATLTIVGRRPSRRMREWIARLGAQGVRLYSDVPEVLPYLTSAAVAVNPVQTGAGLNVKVLHGMQAGCAVVSTSVGAAGMPWLAGRDLVVADRPEDFAAAVVALLADPAERGRIAAAGHRYAREHLDPASNFKLLEELLDSIATRRTGKL